MRILLFANGMRGAQCLKVLCESEHRVIAVCKQNQSDKRWRNPSLLDSLLIQYSIPGFTDDEPEKKSLKSLKADIGVVAGYTPKLSKEVIDLPKYRTIGLHGGPLPQYRGGSPLNWQIINGEKEIELCIYRVTEEVDRGNIIIRGRFPINQSQDITYVLEKSIEIFPQLLLIALTQIKEGKPEVPQEGEGHTWPKRWPEDGKINWDDTPEKIVNLIRALAPPYYPGAYTMVNDKKVIIWKASIPSQ